MLIRLLKIVRHRPIPTNYFRVLRRVSVAPRSSILDTPIAIYLNRPTFVKENTSVPQSIQLSVGTIGGPETFAGQATQMLRRLYPVLGELSYFQDASSLFSALDTGAA